MASRATAPRGREWIALLDCGTRLTYDSRTFLPEAGEVVPCRRHGYCRTARTAFEQPDPPAGSSRARPRSQHELVEYVRDSPGRTLSALRRDRFTLRLVYAAAASGEVVIADSGGRLLVHATR